MALKAKTMAEAFLEIMERSPSPRTGKPPMRQIELGRVLGINPSNISRITNPKINQLPTDDILRRLANAFPNLTTFEELVRIRDNTPTSGRRRRPITRRTRIDKEETAQDLTQSSISGTTEPDAKGDTASDQPAANRREPAPMAATRFDMAASAQSVAVASPTDRGRRGSFFAGVPLPRGARPPSVGENHTITDISSTERPVINSGQKADVAPSTPRHHRASVARPLIAEHLPAIGSLARSLQAMAQADEVVSSDMRFAVAVSVALTELERAVGDQVSAPDTHAAAAALVNDLWRLALGGQKRDNAELQPSGLPAPDRERFEAFLSVAPERQESYRRIVTALGPILFPLGATEEELERLHNVVLRAFAVGAHR